jgi:hypothetical protein
MYDGSAPGLALRNEGSEQGPYAQLIAPCRRPCTRAPDNILYSTVTSKYSPGDILGAQWALPRTTTNRWYAVLAVAGQTSWPSPSRSGPLSISTGPVIDQALDPLCFCAVETPA